jgi:ssDNA-binding Zn-finger/Zn-ribbon topoisomerase 1
MEVICPYCDSEAVLESSLTVYQKDHGMIYICSNYPICDAYVGCHKGTDQPLGRLADKELRFWKMKAHKYFDVLWKAKLIKMRKESGYKYKKGYARGAAYKWLANELGIKKKHCHIGLMDVNTCQQVAEICYPYWQKYKHLENVTLK